MTRKIPNLQGLRGWAIVLVTLWHLNAVFPGNLPKTGDFGVEFFLLLSGWLTARKCDLHPEALRDFRSSFSYALGKLKNIYPMYILFSAGVFALDSLYLKTPFSEILCRFLPFAALVQNWIPVSRIVFGVNSAGWFLPVILFCWTAVPLVRRAVSRLGALKALLLCYAAQVAAEILAWRFLSRWGATWLTYPFPPSRLLDFTMGFCAYGLSASLPRMKPRTADALYLLALAGYAVLAFAGRDVLQYTPYHPFEIALLLLVASGASPAANALHGNRLAVRAGDLSLFAFLLNVPVIRLTGILWRRVFGTGYPVLLWAVSFAAVFASAALVSRLAARRAP